MFGISVDAIEANFNLAEKLILSFPLLSDPGGTAIKAYGFWEERGIVTPLTGEKASMAKPGIVVTDPEGIIRYVYEGTDFADRPGDKLVFDTFFGGDP